ncbi:MAG: hypothetical protein SGILL_010553, partial [Bacillariaceae sp.]
SLLTMEDNHNDDIDSNDGAAGPDVEEDDATSAESAADGVVSAADLDAMEEWIFEGLQQKDQGDAPDSYFHRIVHRDIRAVIRIILEKGHFPITDDAQDKDDLVSMCDTFLRIWKNVYGKSREEPIQIKELHILNHLLEAEQESYLMAINQGRGRILIPETSTGVDGSPPLEQFSDGYAKPVPVSVWPLVISKSNTGPNCTWREEWQPSEETCALLNYTAVYRMLRPNSEVLGPALARILGSDSETGKDSEIRKVNHANDNDMEKPRPTKMQKTGGEET